MNNQPMDPYTAFRYGSEGQLRDAIAAHTPPNDGPKRRVWPLLAVIAGCLAIMLATVWLAPKVAAVSGANAPLPQSMSRPCPQEDSVNCYWDAGSSGNHLGHSFVVRQFPGSAHMVCVMYQGRRYAHTHDYCEGNDVAAVYVYLDRSDQPTRVFRTDVGRVHMRGARCIATVVGYDHWVELANVTQYPNRCDQ